MVFKTKTGNKLSKTKKAIKPEDHLTNHDKQLISYDPLTSYLREISVYAPLTREEEQELAIRYKDNNDLQAAYRLVTSNLWLVVKIAREYKKAAKNLLDLIQEGNLGLLEAVKKFDPYRGVRLPSYAVWWIKAYMIRYLMTNLRLVKIGTTQAQRKLFFNLKKEKERLEKEGFDPSTKLLAEKLEVKESEVLEMEQRLANQDVSIDISPTNDQSVVPIVATSEPSPLDNILTKEKNQAILNGLGEFAKTLNKKQQAVFNERLLKEDKATLHELSEKLGVSKERVRQIENQLKDKLKSFLKENYSEKIDLIKQL